MIKAIWPSKDSKMYSDMRIALKAVAEEGKPTLSRKEANRTWREDILGILSHEQKQAQKEMRQKKNNKNKKRAIIKDEDE